MKQVAQDFSDYFVVMRVDRASWHTTQRLNVPENICLILKPAGSPELNPAEYLWKAPREKAFSNTSFPPMETLEEALCTAINPLAGDPHRLRSLTDFPSIECRWLTEGSDPRYAADRLVRDLGRFRLRRFVPANPGQRFVVPSQSVAPSGVGCRCIATYRTLRPETRRLDPLQTLCRQDQ